MDKLPITLKKILTSRKISAKELSVRSGLSVSRISDMLSGRNPSLPNLIKVAETLNVSIDFLLKGEADKKPEESHIQVLTPDFQKVYELDEVFKLTITLSKDKKGKK